MKIKILAFVLTVLGITTASLPVAAEPAGTDHTYRYTAPTGHGYSDIDWALMERCWKDAYAHGPRYWDERHQEWRYEGTPVRPGCSGDENLALACHWTIDYPDRYWVEQACGPIAEWPDDFGERWWRGQDSGHPAARWVANLRAGGQP